MFGSGYAGLGTQSALVQTAVMSGTCSVVALHLFLASTRTTATMAPGCASSRDQADNVFESAVRFRSMMACTARLALLSVLCGSGCGGSSSETPPPQPPDSWQMVLRPSAAKAADAQQPAQGQNQSWKWGRYAHSPATWGSDRAKNKPMFDAGVPEEL